MPEKILVADDDAKIRDLVRRALAGAGFSVVATDNGADALSLAQESKPDLVLLDAEMPGLDGHALTRVLKRGGRTGGIPVIIMSGAMVSDRDVLAGFEGGADDYLLKPFSLAILVARVQAVLRRYAAPANLDESIRKAGIVLDPAGRTVTIGKRRVPMTRKEFDLLATLLSKSGRFLSVPYLLETVWGYDPADYNDPGTVEVHVSHLRKKLGPKLGPRLVNVPGHGYKFDS